MMGPKQTLGAVSHVLVSERTRTHRVKHHTSGVSVSDPVIDSDRFPIAVALDGLRFDALAQRRHLENRFGGLEYFAEVLLHHLPA